MRRSVLLLSLPFLLLPSACGNRTGAMATHPPQERKELIIENVNDLSMPANSWDKDEIKHQITGQTFLRNMPGKQNEVFYFGEDNIVYQWVSGRQAIATSTWVVDSLSPRMGETARLYICTTLPNPATMQPGFSVYRRCMMPALLFMPASEHAAGDVFSLVGKTQAPGELTIERTTIANIKKQLNAPAGK